MTKTQSVTIVTSIFLVCSTIVVVMLVVARDNTVQPQNATTNKVLGVSTSDETSSSNNTSISPMITLQTSRNPSATSFDVLCEYPKGGTCELWGTEGASQIKVKGFEDSTAEQSDAGSRALARWTVRYDEVKNYSELYVMSPELDTEYAKSVLTPVPRK